MWVGGRKNSCVTLTDLLIRYIITTQHLDKLYTFVYIRILGYYNDIFLYENFIIIAFFCCVFRIFSVKRKDDSYMANYSYTNLYVHGPQEELANLFKKAQVLDAQGRAQRAYAFRLWLDWLYCPRGRYASL